ncbi:MAG: ABC transporter permease [Bacilli bacterium]
MYFNLSVRNVKRSIRDYAIYFMTLVLAVSIFYCFNSIGSQSIMFEMNETASTLLDEFDSLMGIVTVFVTVILATLILYANMFIVKRRKKEIGMYMTLGMSKRAIGRILLGEIIVIAGLALVVGLGLGVFLSQGMSFLTAALFEIDMKAYTFVFSPEAALKTCLYFIGMFVIVALFQRVTISRFKLIDLLYASRKNEKQLLKHTWVSGVLFLLSIAILGVSYWLVLDQGLFEAMNISVALGCVGTLLFFWSLSSLLTSIVQKMKPVYFRGTNMFLVRQLSSKMNTTFFSVSVICIMLFFTIGVLSTGLSMKEVSEKDAERNNPFDASFGVYFNEPLENETQTQPLLPISKVTDKSVNWLANASAYHEFIVYDSPLRLPSMLYDGLSSSSKKEAMKLYDMAVNAIKISDYNALMKMNGQATISLGKDEIILASESPTIQPLVEEFAKNTESILLSGQRYTINREKIIESSFANGFLFYNQMALIVPDNVVTTMKPAISVMNMNYPTPNVALEKQMTADVEKYNETNSNGWLGTTIRTLELEQTKGMGTFVVYVGIYLGIVSLISSAAVLALQQLTEAADNSERYRTLSRIGVAPKQQNQTLFRQISLYFILPLGLALVHSYFGIKVVNAELLSFGKASVFWPAIFTTLIFIVVYGGYFWATYIGCKNIIRQNQ